MLNGLRNGRGLSVLASLVLALIAIAVFPEAGNAHGIPGAATISSGHSSYPDAGQNAYPASEPSYTNSHCHSNTSQDCSTQVAFLIPSVVLAYDASTGAIAPVISTLRNSWLLSFDPPPPRFRF